MRGWGGRDVEDDKQEGGGSREDNNDWKKHKVLAKGKGGDRDLATGRAVVGSI